LLDFTPLAFAITGLILLWGVRRYQLWDITPIARTTVFERLADGVMVIDIEHRLVDINQEGARILGVPRASLIGTSFAQLAIVWPALADLNLDNVEETVVLEQHQDPPRIFHGRMTPLLTPTEQVGGWTLVLHDMTEQHEFTRQLAAMAYYDTITGLPNRRLFQERLEEALEQIHGTALSVGVIFIDIDRFKQINDTLGHAVGDTVLRCVAEQFDLCLNDTDTVARLGGDEFIIVLPDIHGRRDLYQTACRILERFEAPLIIGKHRLRLTPSLGLTIAPEQGTTVERLIIQADLAMYQAKQNGRNTFAFYTPKQEPQYALSEHPN